MGDEQTDDPEPGISEVLEAVKDLKEEMAEKERGLEELINEFATALAEHEETPFSESNQARDAIKELLRSDGDVGKAYAETLEIAEGIDLGFAEETEKEVGMDTVVQILSEMDNIEAPADEIADSLSPLFSDYDEEEKSEEETETEAETAEKRADEANLSKTAGATETAQEGVTGEGGATTNPLANRNAAAANWGAE